MEQTHDIIVLGSGGAGCAAAAAAAGFGLETLLVEKAALLGGGTADSLGTFWMPSNSLAAKAGLDDPLEEALVYARFVAGGQAIEANLDAYVRHAARVLDGLMELGVGLQLALNLPDYFAPHGPHSRKDGRRMVEPALIARSVLGEWADRIRPSLHNVEGVAWSDAVRWGGFANRRNWPQEEIAERQRQGMLGCGGALVAQLLAVLLRRGGTILAGQQVEALLQEDGRVAGLRLADGSVLRARRGVILATGGYEGSAALVRQLEGFPDWLNPFAPGNTGEALLMGQELGAAVHRIAVNNSLFVGCDVPGEAGGFYSVGLRGLPYPGAIAVNAAGRRFCDETQFQDVIMALQAYDRGRRAFANLPAHMIFDERFRQRYTLPGGVPGGPAPDWVARGNTPQALAATLGIDAEGLAATIARFSADAERGEDTEYGRGRSAFSRNNAGDRELPNNPQLAPLAQPPFYGIRLRMGGVCSAGLLTDDRGRVVHVRGHAIPGLYACGNTAAPSFHGVGYQGGASIGAGIVFGWLAAEDAAGVAA